MRDAKRTPADDASWGYLYDGNGNVCQVMLMRCIVNNRVFLVLLCPLVLADLAMPDQAPKQVLTTQSFQRAYLSAVDDRAKRDVIIRAIEDKLLAPRMTLPDVRSLFGNELVLSMSSGDGRKTGYVRTLRYKTSQPTSRPDADSPAIPTVQPPDVGWGIYLTFSMNDKLEYYYLRDKSAKSGGRLTSNPLTAQECEEFRDSYRQAADDKAKRGIVMQAMDNSLIYFGMRLSELKDLFGDNLHLKPRDQHGLARGYVLFDDSGGRRTQPGSEQSAVFPSGQGWYIEFTLFRKGTHVESYVISNVQRRLAEQRTSSTTPVPTGG